MDLQTKIIVIGGFVEIALRIVPTKRNLSIVDAVKRIIDIIPNKDKKRSYHEK